MPEPLVSVVMPTYNYGRFIAKAVNSVLNQTYRNVELIVVDNFSQDNTEEIIRSFKDPRLHYYRFANKGVIAASRNHGIRMAKGSYIAFIDSDDAWYERKLEKVMSFFASHPEVALICHDLNKVDEKDNKRTAKCGPHKSYSDLLYKGNCLFTSAITVRTDSLIEAGLFSESPEYVTAEDYDLWLKVAHNGKVSFIHEILGEYSVHSGACSDNWGRLLKNMTRVVEDHYANMPPSIKDRVLMHIRRADLVRMEAHVNLRNNDIKEARRSAVMAFKLNPFALKAWYTLICVYKSRCKEF
jgi:glycosyltransferase involved in cell wall biosynthesis